MCTVTFLPKGPKSYILTSNRDETPTRAALHPIQYERFGHEVWFPKDPLAGGTWIVTDKKRFTLCLLNGAFIAHRRTPPYRLSRGQMVLEFFKYAHVERFLTEYDFNGIEPFTLIIVDSQEENSLTELIWDGSKAHVRQPDANKAHIWSSATLYPEEVAKERATWFNRWLKSNESYDQDQIMAFHKKGGSGDRWNDFVMKRGDNLQTVSITSVERDQTHTMRYEDLLA